MLLFILETYGKGEYLKIEYMLEINTLSGKKLTRTKIAALQKKLFTR